QVRVRVLSSFHEEVGTEIVPEKLLSDSVHVSGITHRGDEARLTLKDVQNPTQAVADIIEMLARAEVHMDMLVQNISIDDCIDITFTVLKGEIPRVVAALNEMPHVSYGDLVIDPNVAKITVV